MATPPAKGPPYAVFADGPPLGSLPLSVQGCLGPNPDPRCDAWMGDYTLRGSFCAMPEMAGTAYCACVNNAAPCPMLNSPACSNGTFAYVPKRMLPGGAEYGACKGANFCVNIAEALGNDDVISNVSQSCTAGTVVQTALKNHPALVALVCLALTLLVLLAQGRGAPRAPRAPHARPRRAGAFGKGAPAK